MRTIDLPRKHHFNPRFYLDRWTGRDKQLCEMREAAVAAESFEAALDLFVVTIFEAQYSPSAVGILPETEFAL